MSNRVLCIGLRGNRVDDHHSAETADTTRNEPVDEHKEHHGGLLEKAKEKLHIGKHH